MGDDLNCLVIGSNGNMGQRYVAILKYFGIETLEFDVVGNSPSLLKTQLSKTSHVIVATPTRSHFEIMEALWEFKLPGELNVLCEKPITQNLDMLKTLYEVSSSKNLTLYCVNQYAFLPQYDEFKKQEDRTEYNYFKTGDDGLYWDCFQLFALANGKITLDTASPLWYCQINGVGVHIEDMDSAYCKMVYDFVKWKLRLWSSEIVIKATKRIIDATSTDRDSGEE